MPDQLQRILFVDDDEDILSIAQLALEDNGRKVDVCSSGEEAIEKAVALNPDLIILDVMMPGMDGIETLRELQKKEETVSIPVIFATARVQRREINQYKSMGAIDVIFKPFNAMSLFTVIHDIYEDWKNQQAR